jgi:Flp pilus assembly pilin Flp
MGRTTMNRWALQRYAAAEVRVRAAADRLADRVAARTAGRGDRGQTSFEYLGIAVVIAVIIGVLASTTDIGSAVKNAITNAITKIAGGKGN